jgi:hypothetical protein
MSPSYGAHGVRCIDLLCLLDKLIQLFLTGLGLVLRFPLGIGYSIDNFSGLLIVHVCTPSAPVGHNYLIA